MVPAEEKPVTASEGPWQDLLGDAALCHRRLVLCPLVVDVFLEHNIWCLMTPGVL